MDTFFNIKTWSPFDAFNENFIHFNCVNFPLANKSEREKQRNEKYIVTPPNFKFICLKLIRKRFLFPIRIEVIGFQDIYEIWSKYKCVFLQLKWAKIVFNKKWTFLVYSILLPYSICRPYFYVFYLAQKDNVLVLKSVTWTKGDLSISFIPSACECLVLIVCKRRRLTTIITTVAATMLVKVRGTSESQRNPKMVMGDYEKYTQQPNEKKETDK